MPAAPVATSDAAGNLATDGGEIFGTLSELEAGIAISMSLGMPILQAGETFGIAVNFGQFKQSSAIGVSTMGLINKDLFGGGEHLGSMALLASAHRRVVLVATMPVLQLA